MIETLPTAAFFPGVVPTPSGKRSVSAADRDIISVLGCALWIARGHGSMMCRPHACAVRAEASSVPRCREPCQLRQADEAILCKAIAAALYIVGLPRLARRVLAKFHWGLHFLELNDELLNAYAACSDGAEVVATQHRILSRWQEEEAQGIGRREMPPSDESSESGSSDEEPDERKGEPVEAGETPADAAVKASKSSESGPAEATAAMECGPCEDAEIGAPVSGGQEELADVTDALEATILNAAGAPADELIEAVPGHEDRSEVAPAQTNAACDESAGAPPVVGQVLEGDAFSLGLVEIRHTGGAKGHGVYAVTALANNTWVGDYVGEVLTQSKYLKRYPAEDAEYVLSANEDYNVDAADPSKSSFLRYANHSCDAPNLFFDVQKVRKQREKTVKFYTARDVAAGEELVFDYGKTYWANRGASPWREICIRCEYRPIAFIYTDRAWMCQKVKCACGDVEMNTTRLVANSARRYASLQEQRNVQ